MVRVTMALTQLPAVEPSCGGELRGVAAQCFVLGSFFNIYFHINPKRAFLKVFKFLFNEFFQQLFAGKFQ
jgi:hypothetical protein